MIRRGGPGWQATRCRARWSSRHESPRTSRAFHVERGIPGRFLVSGHLEGIVAVRRVGVVEAFGNDAGDLDFGG